MLEKEAVERYKQHLADPNYYENSEEESYLRGFREGAEFAYNKANEWQYPSKGQLPKDLCLVSACFWELGKKQVREVYFDSKYFCYHGKHIEPVAWQYYPEPPKENE